jgi:hypothetical protein
LSALLAIERFDGRLANLNFRFRRMVVAPLIKHMMVIVRLAFGLNRYHLGLSLLAEDPPAH